MHDCDPGKRFLKGDGEMDGGKPGPVLHRACLPRNKNQDMLNDSELRKVLDSPLLQSGCVECDHPTQPAALPDAALEFLVALARQCGVASVFEFGSGRSTVAMLREGLRVTSLEDSDRWMEQTRAQLSGDEKTRHIPLVRPLSRRMHGWFPVMDWPVDAALARAIGSADLILVDSPYYAPFRESTLWSALVHNDRALVVLDDTRIPTLSRFCDRLAAANPALLHRRVKVGHTFDIFARTDDKAPLTRSHSLLEILKGWRRFFMAARKQG